MDATPQKEEQKNATTPNGNIDCAAYTRLVDHANWAIKHAQEQVAFYLRAVLGFVTFCVLIGGGAISMSILQLRESTRSSVEHQTEAAIRQAESNVLEKIELRLDREFRSDQIRATIMDGANKEVNQIAAPMITNRLTVLFDTEIEPFHVEAQQLDKKVAAAQGVLEALEQKVHAQELFASADMGSLEAFMNLLLLSKDQSNAGSLAARHAINFLEEKLRQFRRGYREIAIKNSLVVNCDVEIEYLISGITKTVMRQPAEMYYRDLINTNATFRDRMVRVASVGELDWKYFVPVIIEMLGRETNLYASARYVDVLEKLTGRSFGVLPPYSDVAQWWSAEGTTNAVYHNPFPDIDHANALFDKSEFKEAAESYAPICFKYEGLAESCSRLGKCYLAEQQTSAVMADAPASMDLRARSIKAFEWAIKGSDGMQVETTVLAAYYVEDGRQDAALAVLEKIRPFCDDFRHYLKENEGKWTQLTTNQTYCSWLSELDK